MRLIIIEREIFLLYKCLAFYMFQKVPSCVNVDIWELFVELEWRGGVLQQARDATDELVKATIIERR